MEVIAETAFDGLVLDAKVIITLEAFADKTHVLRSRNADYISPLLRPLSAMNCLQSQRWCTYRKNSSLCFDMSKIAVAMTIRSIGVQSRH